MNPPHCPGCIARLAQTIETVAALPTPSRENASPPRDRRPRRNARGQDGERATSAALRCSRVTSGRPAGEYASPLTGWTGKAGFTSGLTASSKGWKTCSRCRTSWPARCSGRYVRTQPKLIHPVNDPRAAAMPRPSTLPWRPAEPRGRGTQAVSAGRGACLVPVSLENSRTRKH